VSLPPSVCEQQHINYFTDSNHNDIFWFKFLILRCIKVVNGLLLVYLFKFVIDVYEVSYPAVNIIQQNCKYNIFCYKKDSENKLIFYDLVVLQRSVHFAKYVMHHRFVVLHSLMNLR
jgi:hypothetical protein